MPEARQLTFLENLAAEKADLQALQLAKARRALHAAEEQRNQLKQYEAGYNTQLGAKLEQSTSIEALRGHHRFMQNVAVAIRQQEVEVARLRAYADAIERAWRETERRRQGFRVMSDKLAEHDRRVDARRQQKINDEFVTCKPVRSSVGL